MAYEDDKVSGLQHRGTPQTDFRPLWIEEPTHPDDIHAHVILVDEIAPVKIAAGEHIPNRVLFKNFLQCSALHFVQADCTRLAGVNEFLTVSLLARQFGLPVSPHAGDMGQIHQHLVLFNHIAMGHESLVSRWRVSGWVLPTRSLWG